MKRVIKMWLALMCLAFLLPSVAFATETNQEIENELKIEVDGDLFLPGAKN